MSPLPSVIKILYLYLKRTGLCEVEKRKHLDKGHSLVCRLDIDQVASIHETNCEHNKYF